MTFLPGSHFLVLVSRDRLFLREIFRTILFAAFHLCEFDLLLLHCLPNAASEEFSYFFDIGIEGGTRERPTMISKSIPIQAGTPIATRLAAPAPEAKTSGMTPNTNDQAVINTARNRALAPAIAASLIVRPRSFEPSRTRR